MTDAFPLVSCLCLTYARPRYLREAIWCFLQQDWPNKELVVVNDHPEPVHLDQPYPGVHVYNLPQRCSSLGAKRNASVRAARGDYLCVWDDDDLSLPWRISESMRHLLPMPDRWIYNPGKGWFSVSNRNYSITENVYHCQVLMRRAAFDHAGGYSDMNTGEDADFERRIPADRRVRYRAGAHELFYVYRWGIDVHHISGLGFDKPGQPTKWEQIAHLTSGKPGGGVITPGFERDYWHDLATEAASKPGVSPEEARLLAERLKSYGQLSPGQPRAGGDQL